MSKPLIASAKKEDRTALKYIHKKYIIFIISGNFKLKKNQQMCFNSFQINCTEMY